jgi:transposase
MLPFSFPGFEIQEVSVEGSRLCISARSTSPTAECPTCHQISTRLHSYYLRSPTDLPVSGQTVHLKLRVRRFRCQNPQCTQQTFAERFPETLAVHAQRTQRLRAILSLFCAGSQWAARRTSACPGRDAHECRHALAARETSGDSTQQHARSLGRR